MTKYTVFFHIGNELGLKTKVLKGRAWLDNSCLRVEGLTSLEISFRDVSRVKMFRLHGLGRVIEIDHRQGRLFLSVVRVMIGQFAFINFFKTGALFKQLSAASENDKT
ncbi:hypothetical protein [Occallatibacter savannae]|uniref:hypothetical protein n=1 Tax=Occallatibacter savannae TaxID=1002691 RepID=UPI000D68B120|nr:hypothetical protein [Occallatibacter savannae]